MQVWSFFETTFLNHLKGPESSATEYFLIRLKSTQMLRFISHKQSIERKQDQAKLCLKKY